MVTAESATPTRLYLLVLSSRVATAHLPGKQRERRDNEERGEKEQPRDYKERLVSPLLDLFRWPLRPPVSPGVWPPIPAASVAHYYAYLRRRRHAQGLGYQLRYL